MLPPGGFEMIRLSISHPLGYLAQFHLGDARTDASSRRTALAHRAMTLRIPLRTA